MKNPSEEEYQAVLRRRRGKIEGGIEDTTERKGGYNSKHQRRLRAAKAATLNGKLEPFPIERFEEFLKVLTVQTKDYGLIPLQLLGGQRYALEEIIEGLKRGVSTFVILKARQVGMSTLFLALDLFWAFEYRGTLGVFATHDEGSRDQFRNQIEVFLEGLPKSHKWKHRTHNRLMLVLENLSVFRYLVAGTKTTTNKLGRSGGCNFCHATEVAFWGSEDDLAALQNTFSELNAHRLYVFESTANGFNHYEDMWRVAEESPAQKAIFVGWWRDERYEFGEEHPLYLQYMPQGTKTPLSKFERHKVGEVKKQYGFKITAGQIAWYRFHLETKCKGDQMMMNQEMPWTAEDAFISTGGAFFTSETLTVASKEASKHLCAPFLIKVTESFSETRLQPVDVRRAELKIWEKPKPGGIYVLGGDPIYGSSDTRDNGVISIYRAYADCCVQVAEYASPSLSAYQFAWVIAFLAGLYDDTMLVLELTGPGRVVYDELKRLKREIANMVPEDDADMRNCLKHMKDFFYTRPDSMTTRLLQFKTSEETRSQLMYKFQDGMYTGRAQVRSKMCIEEMRHVTIDGGYISVPSGKTDDRLFGSAFAYWGWDMRVRKRLLRMNMTMVESGRREEQGDPGQVEGMVRRFLQNAQIDIRQ
jgi:hypothetical protein